MGESEKPFACPSPGCNMSFVNEDHLTVHRKKHDMILNLGSNGKSGVFVADQTPTPTRFIRNCEEVGLFQDLQNVNPFEETFRRAVEAGKTGGGLTVPEVGISDDTLHTPHIFPHIDVPSTNNQALLRNGIAESPVINIGDSSDDDEKNANRIHVDVQNLDHGENSKEITTVELDTESRDSSIEESIIVQEADGESLSTTVINLNDGFGQQNDVPQLSINGKEVQLLIKTEDGKLMQLSAIPVSQSQMNPTTIDIQSKSQTVVIKTEPSLNCSDGKRTTNSASSRLSMAKMKLKQVLKKNEVSSDSHRQDLQASPRILVEERSPPSDKKLDILERNRASSMRARAKRKAWVQQLERSVYNVNEANAALQMEVRALRSEVAKLKTLLLAHKDCPVTKAMEQGNSIVLGPKVISVSAETVQGASLPLVGSAVKRKSAISADVGGKPAKKKPTVSTTKPMILPKSAAPLLQKAKILRNISAVQVVDVERVISKGCDKGKQILIVQNERRETFTENSQRQIIRMNPNFEIENAASKTTGS
ncbi:cyclic AMP-dependent transcription factor ATF-2 isoform X1 [Neodiprion pinetum]|uniref:cyclic AMP-dependent transcription factor ATF-2 isoform X1 n=1 Tax=Neodiprion pinetum TaxID=441929 RepID=UPI001EDDAC3F|nr:cyclic AMP-dependent transcription factor ATF-2 isoform X1 [Neodiprion pinetum]